MPNIHTKESFGKLMDSIVAKGRRMARIATFGTELSAALLFQLACRQFDPSPTTTIVLCLTLGKLGGLLFQELIARPFADEVKIEIENQKRMTLVFLLSESDAAQKPEGIL